MKTLLGDADYLQREGVHLDSLPDDRGVRVETRAPIVVGENDDGMRAGFEVVGIADELTRL